MTTNENQPEDHQMTIKSPDCRDQNCNKCDSSAFDVDADQEAPCECICHRVAAAHIALEDEDGNEVETPMTRVTALAFDSQGNSFPIELEVPSAMLGPSAMAGAYSIGDVSLDDLAAVREPAETLAQAVARMEAEGQIPAIPYPDLSANKQVTFSTEPVKLGEVMPDLWDDLLERSIKVESEASIVEALADALRSGVAAGKVPADCGLLTIEVDGEWRTEPAAAVPPLSIVLVRTGEPDVMVRLCSDHYHSFHQVPGSESVDWTVNPEGAPGE